MSTLDSDSTSRGPFEGSVAAHEGAGRGGRVWERALREARLAIPLGFVVLVLVAAVFANRLAPYNPVQQNITARLQEPGSHHLLGTDQFGRDILSRLLVGARATMEVAFAATALACVTGTVLGMVGGYFAGIAELATVRLADLILSFPPIVLAILIVTMVGPGVVTLIFVIAFLYIPTFTRVTNGQVMTVKRMSYVEASRALGCGTLRIMARTILPNVLSPIIVQFSLTVAGSILLESGLSFLGLGVVPPTPSWGLMIQEGRGYMSVSANGLIWPCLVIVVVILAVNSVGDALRDRLDPRLRGSGGG